MKNVIKIRNFWKLTFLNLENPSNSRNDSELKSNNSSTNPRVINVNLDDESVTHTTDSRTSENKLNLSQPICDPTSAKTKAK